MATGINVAAAAVANAITHVSLHSANPGTTGANEVAGSGYARQALTKSAASGGVVSGSNMPLSFDGPASGAVTHWGGWTAATGGTFIDGGPLQGDTAFNSAGEFEITALSIAVTKS